MCVCRKSRHYTRDLIILVVICKSVCSNYQEVPVWRQVPLGFLCVCVVTVVCLPIETKQIESRRQYDILTIRGRGVVEKSPLCHIPPPKKPTPFPTNPPQKRAPSHPPP
jgi:hypothetical protein